MRLHENEENVGRQRFIEIGFNDFHTVINCAVVATLIEDAVIFYDDPIDTGKPAAIGSQKVSECNSPKGHHVTNGFIVKQDIDWVIDFHNCKDESWREMVAERITEIGNLFIEWCEKENDMVIIIT
jgi:hypothetical protein